MKADDGNDVDTIRAPKRQWRAAATGWSGPVGKL